MNMRIPGTAPPVGVQDTDESRGEALGFVEVAKPTKQGLLNSFEQQVEQCAVFQENHPKLFGDGEDDMPVGAVVDFFGYSQSSLL